MEPWIQMVVTIVCSVIASSGFWAFVNKRSDSRDVKTEMLVGLAHARIVYLGMMFTNISTSRTKKWVGTALQNGL